MKMKALAVAIGGALPVAALASSISVSAPTTVSPEYLAVVGGASGAASVMNLGAGYAQEDVITFTYSATPVQTIGATNAFAFPSTLAIRVFSNTVATGSTFTVESGSLRIFDASDNFVKYRVDNAPATGAGTTVVSGSFGEVDVPAPNFNLSSSSSDVTVTPSSSSAAGAFDSVTATGVGKIVDITGSQFKYAVSGLTRTIDVNTGQVAFVTGTATSDTLTISVVASTASGGAGLLATSGTMALTLTGDFAWVDSNTATNATGIQSGGISFVSGTLGGVSATAISFNLSFNGGSIALRNTKDLTIPEQSLALNLSQIYSGGVKTGFSTESASGKLSLNGSSVTVFAVPSASTVTNFIWMTNTGASGGEVSLTINDNGTEIDLGVIGTIGPKTEFNVAKAMLAALAAQGKELSGKRVHLNLVTKAPASAISVSAAYRVGDDRVNLLTSLETQ